jgi:hypothetical protein
MEEGGRRKEKGGRGETGPMKRGETSRKLTTPPSIAATVNGVKSQRSHRRMKI